MDKFNVKEEQIRHIYFGYDSPQLTLRNAESYGITADDLAAIDADRIKKGENTINQSVVVVIYKER